jgi:hypothetical protein
LKIEETRELILLNWLLATRLAESRAARAVNAGGMRQTLKFGLLPYTHLRIRSLRDQASRSGPIRSSGSDDAIPDPDPDPMIGSFDLNHDSTAYGLACLAGWQSVRNLRPCGMSVLVGCRPLWGVGPCGPKRRGDVEPLGDWRRRCNCYSSSSVNRSHLKALTRQSDGQ